MVQGMVHKTLTDLIHFQMLHKQLSMNSIAKHADATMHATTHKPFGLEDWVEAQHALIT